MKCKFFCCFLEERARSFQNFARAFCKVLMSLQNLKKLSRKKLGLDSCLNIEWEEKLKRGLEKKCYCYGITKTGSDRRCRRILAGRKRAKQDHSPRVRSIVEISIHIRIRTPFHILFGLHSVVSPLRIQAIYRYMLFSYTFRIAEY